MNAIQKKIQVTSRVVAVLTKILYIAMIVAVCFVLAGLIWIMASPDIDSITLGPIKIISPFSLAAGAGISAEEIAGVVSQCFFIAILILANRIFRNISHEYSPFTQKTVKGMKRIAILILVDSIAAPRIDFEVKNTILSATNNAYNFNIELFILAIIMYSFSLIFQYGVELQQQSDETL